MTFHVTPGEKGPKGDKGEDGEGPAVPTSITGGVDSDNHPIASWTNPTDNLPDEWRLEWYFPPSGEDGEYTHRAVGVVASDTSYIDPLIEATGVTAGEFRIYPVLVERASDNSVKSRRIFSPAIVPLTVAGSVVSPTSTGTLGGFSVKVSDGPGSSVIVSWAGLTGTGIDYRLRWRAGSGSWNVVSDMAIAPIIVDLSGQQDGLFTFEVKASSIRGESTASSVVMVSGIGSGSSARQPPGETTDQHVTPGEGEVAVQCQPALTADGWWGSGSAASRKYQWRYREVGSGSSWIEDTSYVAGGFASPSPPEIIVPPVHIITGLTNGVSYEFVSRARTDHGDSGWHTTPVRAMPLAVADYTAPGVPTNVSYVPPRTQFPAHSGFLNASAPSDWGVSPVSSRFFEFQRLIGSNWTTIKQIRGSGGIAFMNPMVSTNSRLNTPASGERFRVRAKTDGGISNWVNVTIP